MVKKYIKAVFNILNKINKKAVLLAFFMIIFSLFVSFTPFQSAEEIKIPVQVAEAEDEPGPPPCVPHCGGCSCCWCDWKDCVGCDDESRIVDGYQEDRDASCTKHCCGPGTCNRTCWYDVESCGDGIQNGPEECDGNDPPPAQCLTNLSGNFPNDGMANAVSYDGRILCNKCFWTSYLDRDGDPSDSMTCIANPFVCPNSSARCDCSPVDGRTCTWQDSCTPIDWCGDGKINGPELYCDIHKDTGTVDFGGETCQSKICGDIDPTDAEDKSLHSKNPACAAQIFSGDLTCVNTCRHIYTVPGCNFPLHATGVDLSDDGLYVYVTDSSLWSLQMFPVSKPAVSTANPDRLESIFYLNTEPLSVDIVGKYAYVGAKGEFSVINTVQLNQPDAFPDPGPPYVFPPFRPKDPPFPFLEEQVLPTVATVLTLGLGHVNDVHIDGNYAYLAIGTEGAVGPAALQIINIANPLAPFAVGSFSFPNTITGVQSVDVSGDYAYVAYTDGNSGVGYFGYFDISDKTNPVLFKKTSISSSTSSIDISGNVACIDGFSTLNTVDITSPAVPAEVLTVDNINVGPSSPPNETFAIDIDDLGTTAYVSVKGIGLRAVDISNPEDISVGIVLAAPVGFPVIVDVIVDALGEYAYAADLNEGLLVFKTAEDCGNGVLDEFEVCDGEDLGGETCVSQGFTEGDLACNMFCNAFDTSGCLNVVPPACEGVVCDTPGLCEIGPGVCENAPDVFNVPICVYPDDPDICDILPPDPCLVGPGVCNKSDGKCYFQDNPILCDLDGDVCTGDRCVSPDGGLSGKCVAGSNICGGLVPCGRMVDDPATSWIDTDPCELCHVIMLFNQGMNFLLEMASIIAVLALVITGFLFITSAGNPERKNSAKTAFKWVIVGFLILFLSWLIVDFILSAWGFLDPLGGKWNVVCE